MPNRPHPPSSTGYFPTNPFLPVRAEAVAAGEVAEVEAAVEEVVVAVEEAGVVHLHHST